MELSYLIVGEPVARWLHTVPVEAAIRDVKELLQRQLQLSCTTSQIDVFKIQGFQETKMRGVFLYGDSYVVQDRIPHVVLTKAQELRQESAKLKRHFRDPISANDIHLLIKLPFRAMHSLRWRDTTASGTAHDSRRQPATCSSELRRRQESAASTTRRPAASVNGNVDGALGDDPWDSTACTIMDWSSSAESWDEYAWSVEEVTC